MVLGDIFFTLKPSDADKAEVFWPLDNAYYPGVISEEEDNNYTAVYEDGSIDTLGFTNGTWPFVSRPRIISICTSSIHLKCDTPGVLVSMLFYFGSSYFRRKHAQDFFQH